MRQYYSNNKNYKAILESMAQIRENQLNEQYGYYAEQDDEEELEEGMHGDEEEMEEAYMYEESDEDEDAQMDALAEMMDEALMELDDEDDDDNQMLGEEEEDGERRARRRARLRNALLIGAGLVATGGLAGAAMMNPVARGMITKGAGQVIGGAGDLVKGVGTTAFNMLPQTTQDQMSAAAEAGQEYVDSTVMPKVQSMASGADAGIKNILQKDNFKVPGLGPDATEAARRAAGRQYMRSTGQLANPTARDASAMRKKNYLNRGGRDPRFSVTG